MFKINKTTGEKIKEEKDKIREEKIKNGEITDNLIQTVSDNEKITCVCVVDNFDQYTDGMMHNLIYLSNNDYIEKIHIIINNVYLKVGDKIIKDKNGNRIKDKRLVEILFSFINNGATQSDEMGITLGKINITYNKNNESLKTLNLIILMIDICETKNIFFIKDFVIIEKLLFDMAIEEYLNIVKLTKLPVYYPSTENFTFKKDYKILPESSICTFIRIPNIDLRHLIHYKI